MNKRLIIYLAVFLFLPVTGLYAQVWNTQEPVQQDTVVIKLPPQIDSSLAGVSVFEMLASGDENIMIHRSSTVDEAFARYLENNLKKKKHGYRIRIFFDNRQSARNQSESVEKNFIQTFSRIPVYRTYENPYFKVAVGDFRTKSDAIRVLNEIKGLYPNAFIIKDVINYPL